MTKNFANLESALAETWPADDWRDVNVVVAVSGGADSVALLRALAASKSAAGGAGQLSVAHLDHRLRPESARDAVWVEKLCERLGVACDVGVAELTSASCDLSDGLENAARAVRYEFLLQTAGKRGARFVAVAHTQDDQVETVLHRILRGTGLTGLSGMHRSRPLSQDVGLIRPLLYTSRSQVLDYLRRIGQDHCLDSTNANERFTRNRIRRELLPLLRAEFNPDVERAVLRLAAQAEEGQQVIRALAENWLTNGVVIAPGRIEIAGDLLALQPVHLIREVCRLAWGTAGLPFQSMGFHEWDLLAQLIVGEAVQSLNMPGRVTAQRSGGRIVIRQGS